MCVCRLCVVKKFRFAPPRPVVSSLAGGKRFFYLHYRPPHSTSFRTNPTLCNGPCHSVVLTESSVWDEAWAFTHAHTQALACWAEYSLWLGLSTAKIYCTFLALSASLTCLLQTTCLTSYRRHSVSNIERDWSMTRATVVRRSEQFNQ